MAKKTAANPPEKAVQKNPPAAKKAVRKRKAPSTPKPRKAKTMSAAEKLVAAMEELTEHLKSLSKCHPMKAYGALPQKHKDLFDNLTKAISVRIYGENPQEP